MAPCEVDLSEWDEFDDSWERPAPPRRAPQPRPRPQPRPIRRSIPPAAPPPAAAPAAPTFEQAVSELDEWLGEQELRARYFRESIRRGVRPPPAAAPPAAAAPEEVSKHHAIFQALTCTIRMVGDTAVPCDLPAIPPRDAALLDRGSLRDLVQHPALGQLTRANCALAQLVDERGPRILRHDGCDGRDLAALLNERLNLAHAVQALLPDVLHALAELVGGFSPDARDADVRRIRDACGALHEVADRHRAPATVAAMREAACRRIVAARGAAP